MSDLGRMLVLAGGAIVLIGLVLWGLGRAGFRGLPGDIRIETDHARVYIPIVTCIVLSVLLTALVWLWRWLRK